MPTDNSETHQDSYQNNGENGGNLDPYFIANSDSPTSSLVSAVFNGSNYLRWKRNVMRALIAKNKEVSWILSSMNNELADDFGYIDNAGELWKELNERFGQSNRPLIYQLKKEIDSLKQENMTIVTYYGKLKKLWEEMQSLRAFPTCICGALNSCSCQILKKIAEFEEEEDRMMKFLLGLNGGFEGTVTNVLSMDPLPSINIVFAIAQQIEKQKEVSGAAVEASAMSSSAMAAQSYKGDQSQRFAGGKKYWKEIKKEKMHKICTHCKGKGHTVDQCFKLIGYPDWYNTIKASKGSQYQANGSRLVANVNSDPDVGDNPLDDQLHDSAGSVNNEMISAISKKF
ncbi:uncharacterized protein [Spinacia oleracea]|uniref:Retrotransposon Copia-like N-terminal domain-containing protein n=1 Tax=Spinacia oleracea TaxID=3562 RepID=A0ABM3QQQ3_SPIOL|nr:uncharacterized protein LOC130461569 [Spinacia oleracea]